jgi:hypothetical protein
MAMFQQLKIMGGAIMKSKDVSIKGFNSNFVNFLQVQTK